MRTKDGSEADESPDHVVGLFVAEALRRVRPNVQLVRCQQPNHAVGGEPDAKGDLADRGQPSIDQEGAEDLARLQRDAVGNATGEGFAGQVDQLFVGCLLERARQLGELRGDALTSHINGERDGVELPCDLLFEVQKGSFPLALQPNFGS